MRKAITEDRVEAEAFEHWQYTDENDEPIPGAVAPGQPPHLRFNTSLERREVELLSDGEQLALLRYEADERGNLTFERVTE